MTNPTINIEKSYDGYFAFLMLEGKSIGYVKVVVSRASIAGSSVKLYETHSCLDTRYHRKGYGIMMYAAAIRHGLKKGLTVTSSRSTSAMAQRVWKSKRLGKMFNVVKIGKRWWVQKEAT